MTSQATVYFPDAIPLSKVDVSKIYFDNQVKGESLSASSMITYDRIPIKYRAPEGDKGLTFEFRTQGKINKAVYDGKENYTMILRTVQGMDKPSPAEQANIDKLEAIEAHIQSLARAKKIPIKTSKSTKSSKFVDPDDLIILRRNKTPQGDDQNPVLFAKIYSEGQKIALGDNFRKLNTRKEFISTNGRCGIHAVANPDNYQDCWMDLVAVVRVSGIFIGNVQSIQVRLGKAIVIKQIKRVPVINPAIQALMPDDESEDDTEEAPASVHGDDSSDEATIVVYDEQA